KCPPQRPGIRESVPTRWHRQERILQTGLPSCASRQLVSRRQPPSRAMRRRAFTISAGNTGSCVPALPRARKGGLSPAPGRGKLSVDSRIAGNCQGWTKPASAQRLSSDQPRRAAMRLETYRTETGDINAARWQARVDLAAAHRLTVMHGLHEGIFNHL